MSWLKITDMVTGKEYDSRNTKQSKFLDDVESTEDRMRRQIAGEVRSLYVKQHWLDECSYDEIENMIFDLKQELKKRKKDAKVRNNK